MSLWVQEGRDSSAHSALFDLELSQRGQRDRSHPGAPAPPGGPLSRLQQQQQGVGGGGLGDAAEAGAGHCRPSRRRSQQQQQQQDAAEGAQQQGSLPAGLLQRVMYLGQPLAHSEMEVRKSLKFPSFLSFREGDLLGAATSGLEVRPRPSLGLSLPFTFCTLPRCCCLPAAQLPAAHCGCCCS